MNKEYIRQIKEVKISVEAINNMEVVKNDIYRIINDYLPNNNSGKWDALEALQEDIRDLGALMCFLSPKIGFLEGLVTTAEENKKLAKAKGIKESSTEKDENTKKTKSLGICEAEGRIKSEPEIEVLSKIVANNSSYRAFQYQVNKFIDILSNRVKNLLNEDAKGI